MHPLPVPATDPIELLRARDGLYADDLLVAAVAHLDLFSSLAEDPCDLAELARRLGVADRPAGVMCTLFLAMGLLEALLLDVGFVDVQERPAGAGRSVVLARRPA